MSIGICKFCGSKTKLVKSHIIPKAMYWELNDSQNRPSKLLSPFDGEFEKRYPYGFYDYFLCDEHEKQFNDWDTYACTLLRDSQPKVMNNGWVFDEVDYTKIKLFFISMLWRAHIASNDFFEKIRLGPHENRLKNLITQENPSNPDDYAVVLWRSEEILANAIIAPYRERYEGISFIRFYLPKYMALIKVDQRPLSPLFQKNALKKSYKWFVTRKKYEGESEEKIMKNIANKNLIKKDRNYFENTKNCRS